MEARGARQQKSELELILLIPSDHRLISDARLIILFRRDELCGASGAH